MRRRNIGSHVEDLADGRSVAPGEFITLDPEPKTIKHAKDTPADEREAADEAALAATWAHPHNARLVEEGTLADAPEKAASTTTDESEG